MMQEIFEALGFREEEVKSYLTLLDTGPVSAGNLARRLGAPRPTVYGHLERLVRAGLATEGMRRGVKVFAPEPAEKLRFLYARRIEEMRAREKALDALIPELDRRAGLNLLRPRMQFFEGREGIEAALEDVLTTMPPGSMTLAFWPIRASMDVTSAEFFRWHNVERIRRDIHIKGIWPRTQGVDIKRFPFMGHGQGFKRELRYAPEEVEFTMGYWVYGSKTTFISSRAKSFGFTIESAELSALMSTQHQMIWKISEPVPFDPGDVQAFLKEVEEGI